MSGFLDLTITFVTELSADAAGLERAVGAGDILFDAWSTD